jgi:hypothetical protein
MPTLMPLPTLLHPHPPCVVQQWGMVGHAMGVLVGGVHGHAGGVARPVWHGVDEPQDLKVCQWWGEACGGTVELTGRVWHSGLVWCSGVMVEMVAPWDLVS